MNDEARTQSMLLCQSNQLRRMNDEARIAVQVPDEHLDADWFIEHTSESIEELFRHPVDAPQTELNRAVLLRRVATMKLGETLRLQSQYSYLIFGTKAQELVAQVCRILIDRHLLFSTSVIERDDDPVYLITII